jgi:ABC-2 type transport system permease protein
MWGRVFSLVLKEGQQFRRDRAAKFRLLIPTLVQLFIFGYAATFEVYNVATVVLDLDHSQESRELISHFGGSGRFQIVKTAKNAAEVRQAIDRADAVVAIVIQAGFAENLRKGLSAPAQVVVDGTNSNTALIALNYVGQIVATYAETMGQDLKRRQNAAAPAPPTVTLEPRPW